MIFGVFEMFLLLAINYIQWLVREYPDSKVHGANMRPIWGR